MDNRRVFKSSYREKTREKASPYARNNGGLFSKVKSFFAPAIWSSNTDESAERTNANGAASPADSLKPFTFPEPETSLIHTPSKGDKAGLQLQPPLGTPNKVLSSFFQEKGDKPLSEVEYEGVVSLLAQARSQNNTPNNSVIYRGENAESDKPFEPASESTAHNQTHNDSVLKSEPHNFAITPYNQTTLRSGDGNDASAILSTPDYKPVYHSVNDSKNIPSVKRVYQFSGLPSPYRTRIKVPSFSKPKRPAKISPNSTANSSFLNPSHSSRNNANNKPMSNTANTLLNILDGNTSGISETSEPDNSMKKFSNPYSGQSSVRKRKAVQDKLEFSHNLSSTPTKKVPRTDSNDNDNDNINDSEIHNSNIITADDISKTVSFNKAEELPVPEKKTQASKDPEFDLFPSKVSQDKTKPPATTPHASSNPPSSTLGNPPSSTLGNPPSSTLGQAQSTLGQAPSTTPNPLKNDSASFSSNGKPDTKPNGNTFNFAASNGTNSQTFTPGTSFSAKPAFAPALAPNASSTKPAFAFGSSTSNGHTADTKAAFSTADTKAAFSDQFEFPIIEPVSVHLDPAQVEKYKDQFHF